MKFKCRFIFPALLFLMTSCVAKQVKDLDRERLEELQQLGLDLESPVDRNTMMGGAVQAVILSHITEIDACYKKRLKEIPTLEGDVTTQFSFETNGKLSAFAIIESTLNDEKVHACVKNLILKMDFPTSDKPMDVTYKFKFTQEK